MSNLTAEQWQEIADAHVKVNRDMAKEMRTLLEMTEVEFWNMSQEELVKLVAAFQVELRTYLRE